MHEGKIGGSSTVVGGWRFEMAGAVIPKHGGRDYRGLRQASSTDFKTITTVARRVG